MLLSRRWNPSHSKPPGRIHRQERLPHRQAQTYRRPKCLRPRNSVASAVPRPPARPRPLSALMRVAHGSMSCLKCSTYSHFNVFNCWWRPARVPGFCRTQNRSVMCPTAPTRLPVRRTVTEGVGSCVHGHGKICKCTTPSYDDAPASRIGSEAPVRGCFLGLAYTSHPRQKRGFRQHHFRPTHRCCGRCGSRQRKTLRHAYAGLRKSKSPADLLGYVLDCLVAGTGFEPVTFGL